MKDKLYGIGMFGGYIIFLGGWIYNIVWILDNWGRLSTFSKVIDIFTVFAFPIGSLFGLGHFISSLF